MVMDIGIRVQEDDGLLQIFLGTIQPVQLEINPPQAVEVGAVRRIGLDGFLDHGLRFFQANSAVGKHETQIIQHGRIVFLYLESFSKSLFGVAVLLLFFVEGALKEMHLLFVRKTLNGSIQDILRVVKALCTCWRALIPSSTLPFSATRSARSIRSCRLPWVSNRAWSVCCRALSRFFARR